VEKATIIQAAGKLRTTTTTTTTTAPTTTKSTYAGVSSRKEKMHFELARWHKGKKCNGKNK